MIGKVKQNSSFRSTLGYVLGKPNASLIGGNMAGDTVGELTYQFLLSWDINPNIKRPVYHISLSLPHNEHLSDFQFAKLSQTYLERMGVSPREHLYSVIRHQDRQHDHIHIVASRINCLSGKVANDSFERYRSQQVIRELEAEYGLTVVPSSWEVDKRAGARSQINTADRAIHKRIQTVIDEVAPTAPDLPAFVEGLCQQGVSVELAHSRTGTIQGIRYKLGSTTIAGSKLGSRYSLPALQRQGIDCSDEAISNTQHLIDKQVEASSQPDLRDESIHTQIQTGIDQVPSTVTDDWSGEAIAHTQHLIDKQVEVNSQPDPRDKGIHAQIQTVIDQVTLTVTDLPSLVDRLNQQGISVEINRSKTGAAQGIRYTFGNTAISHSHVEDRYSLLGLQRRGINCSDEAIATTQQLILQAERANKAVPILVRLLKAWKQMNTARVDGKRYQFVVQSIKVEGHEVESTLTIYRKDPSLPSPVPIFTLQLAGKKVSFSLKDAHLTDQDCNHFVQVKQYLEKVKANSNQGMNQSHRKKPIRQEMSQD